MTAALRRLWRPLRAAAVLAAVGAAPAGAPAAPTHGCAPTGCALSRPSADELGAIVAEADRLHARYAGDSTLLGRQCAALGEAMRARASDVRMLAYMWREPDPTGHLAPVTGDAHTVEPAAGAGTVHIARGYDALNPDRGLPAILETARHEFAHLSGARQAPGGFDAAAELATACGPGE